MSSHISLSVPGMKDQIELSFRTIRLGTMRTFPVKVDPTKSSSYNQDASKYKPLLFSDKGIKFMVSLDQSGTEEVVIKISAKRIQCIHAYMARGCPVLWIKPDSVVAERIRDICSMHNRRGPYLDPESTANAENEIAVIPVQDPLPFAVSHSIQKIFQRIARKRNLKYDQFFIPIPSKENNDKLVQCTVYMDNVENHRHGPLPVSELRKQSLHQHKKIHSKKFDSETSDEFSDGYQFDDDIDDTAFRIKIPSEREKSSRNLSLRKASKKLSVERIKDPVVSPEKRREKEKEINVEKRKEPPIEAVVNADAEKNHSLLSTSSSPTSETPRKVHRARKSIPNRHRVVSIESQLRARIEEQSPKSSPIKRPPDQDGSSSCLKRKRSEESDGSDSSRKRSGSDSPLESLLGKKKPKEPCLWTSRKKKFYSLYSGIVKKKTGNSSGSASPSVDAFDSVSPIILPKPSGQFANRDPAATRPSKPTDRRSQAVTLHMKTLCQDADSLLRVTPLCTCVVKSPHSFKISSDESAKCMAIDHVDGRLYGCFHDIRLPEMFRPSSKVPVLGLCDEHRERMLRHESCPGCGTFCTGGVFLVCIKNPECPHRFHRDCMVLSGRHGDCPHCGGDLSNVKEVNLPPGHDEDLMWILAGHNPEKMRTKQYVEERGRSARMGHRPAISLVPEVVPGVTEVLPSGVSIDLTTLTPGLQREHLHDMLIHLREDPEKKNRFQPKLFLQHVGENDLAKVLQMLGDGFDLSLHKSILDRALLEAVPDHHLAIIHVLLQAGADVNARYENGETPLFRALHKRNKDLMFYLLINKADVKIMDEEGMTCLHRCAMDGYIEGCYLLMRYGKANINDAGDGGYTPIMWAAEHKQVNMVRYLLHYGADVSRIDNEGNICLQWAALSGNIDILMLCLQRNSKPNHRNTHGDTALHIAARENNYDCISLLLSYGADSTIENNERDTPLCCSPEKNTSWMMLKVNEWVRKAGLINKLVLPLNRERMLCEDLSRGYDKVPIPCVNAIDDTPCPIDPPGGFHYVTENVHTSSETRINYIVAANQTCLCNDQCRGETCHCGIISEGCWYAEDGTLLPSFDILQPSLVFECNKMCKCSRTCSNRVVQNGIKYRLQVYRTVGMNWGVRALEPIPRGAFVCDYVGELISDAEADVREDDSYLFDLENKDGEMYCIDARSYGNVSRFINHLCEPNLVPIRVFVDHHDIRFPKLAYFATRDINAYEELGFDYGDRFWDVKCRQFTCHCASPKCKYSAEAYRKKALKQAEEEEKKRAEENQREEANNSESGEK